MQKQVLIVDDNPMLVRYLSRLLDKHGHNVKTAGDGFEALEILSDFRPDILFIDLIMPRIGGDKLCRVIRQMKGLEASTIVVVSAAAPEIDFAPAAVGADACIAKGPFGAMGRQVLAAVAGTAIPDPDDHPESPAAGDDPTSRRLTRELLSHSRHFEAVLESIDEGILEVYAHKIVYANTAAINLLGRPLEKLLATYPADLFDPAARDDIENLLGAPQDSPAGIGRGAPAKLNDRLVTLRRLPVKGEEQTALLMICDITDEIRMERRLQHARKMEAIATIAGGVAHNFRNALAGIMMNGQILQVRHPADRELQQVVGRISKAVNRGAGLVDGLLQFSRKQIKSDYQETDLVGLVAEVIEKARPSFDRRIAVSVNGPQSVTLVADPSGLGRALSNICTNAREAMPSGGRLTVDVKSGAGGAVVTVTDTGIGMDSEVLNRCFEPFFTTKDISTGTGLGLSAAYGIVRDHDGEIGIHSEPGRGTTVTVTLPYGSDKLAAEPDDHLKLVFGSGEKVLVVDDERELGEAVPDLLRSLGYRVSVAGTANDAISCLATWRPDLVMINFDMAAGEGPACADRVWQEDPDARILAVSGDDGDTAVKDRRGRLHGAVAKPVDLGELSRVLAETSHPSVRP